MNLEKPCLFQIAFSVADLPRTIDFYKNLFELDDSGSTRAFRGEIAEYVQGIKGIASTTYWLQDGRREFQLEFFQFEYPRAHPKPTDYRACDIGMTRIAFYVQNLDEILIRSQTMGVPVGTATMTINGKRHAIIKDPDENIIELIEAPEKLTGKRKSQVAGVAMSVPDLGESLQFFTKAFDMPHHDNPPGQSDGLWNLKGANRDSVLLDGGLAWIEISQYHTPVPKPWRDGHLLTDIGISHIAFSTASMKIFDDLFQRSVKAGLRPNNPEPMKNGDKSAVMYCKDPHGFTIELTYLHDSLHSKFGLGQGC
jgi:catechol 2,3-dioxygenase-like lactoylglutathione lyase family enzyme